MRTRYEKHSILTDRVVIRKLRPSIFAGSAFPILSLNVELLTLKQV
jgi:hypothetical protein